MMRLCCRILSMLARIVLIMSIGILLPTSGGAQVVKKPDVFVVILDAEEGLTDAITQLFKDERASSEGGASAWTGQTGSSRFLPARAANVASVLYGVHPLELGVVCDLDWRRKPVMQESIADRYLKAGYHTAYFGEWGLGRAQPYDPLSRGFEKSSFSSTGLLSASLNMGVNASDSPTDLPPKERPSNEWIQNALNRFMVAKKPFFCVLRQGRYLNEHAITSLIKNRTELDRPTVVMVLRSKSKTSEPQLDQVPDRYYDPGEWSIYHQGQVKNIIEAVEEMKGVTNIWDFNRVLDVLLGNQITPKLDYTFYHKACWPLEDAPEKYRHRNSMVIGKKMALIDGLQLYPLDANGNPDLSQPLDLAENVKEHQALLMVYGQWWKRCRESLVNPRPFLVGKKGQGKVLLTVLDWRPSKIIKKNGGSPISIPETSMSDLRSIVRALQSNEKYRQSFPAYSGSWSVNISGPGRYKITASLLGREGSLLNSPRLQGGRAHLRLGSNELQLRIMKGATSVSASVDADSGVMDLECWFTGQLALERELGAFYVEIERVGDKKFNLKSQPEALPSKVEN